MPDEIEGEICRPHNAAPLERTRLLRLVRSRGGRAGARGHAAPSTAVATTATAAASSVTTTSAAAVSTTVATATTEPTLAVSAVALHLVESVVGVGRGSRNLMRLGVVVRPRLGVAWGSRGGSRTRLNLAGLPLNVDPLLRKGHVVGLVGASIPLAFSGSIGGAVGDIGIAWGDVASRGLDGVAVCQGDSGAVVDLRQSRVGDGGVGLGLAGLGTLGFSRGSIGVERSSMADGRVLDLGDWSCVRDMGRKETRGGSTHKLS